MSDKLVSYALERKGDVDLETQRLAAQANAWFEAEVQQIKPLVAELAPKVVLDLGCGSGTYGAIFGQRFGIHRLVGADRNAKLLEITRQRGTHHELHHIELTDDEQLGALLRNIQPDLVLLRFVFQHMTPDRAATMMSVFAKHHPHVSVLIIDCNDETNLEQMAPPSFVAMIERARLVQARHNGDRDIMDHLRERLSPDVWSLEGGKVICDPDTVDVRLFWSIFERVFTYNLAEAPELPECRKHFQDMRPYCYVYDYVFARCR